MDFIESITTNDELVFVGEFKIKKNNTNLISFDWCIDSKQKKDKRGRVYFFIEEDLNNQKKILKIGKSNDKNGIGGTIGFYVNTLTGTPSITRFSLHHLIYEKLNQNKRVFVYTKYSESIKKEVTGIFKKSIIEIPLDITYIEELCLKEHYGKQERRCI